MVHVPRHHDWESAEDGGASVGWDVPIGREVHIR